MQRRGYKHYFVLVFVAATLLAVMWGIPSVPLAPAGKVFYAEKAEKKEALPENIDLFSGEGDGYSQLPAIEDFSDAGASEIPKVGAEAKIALIIDDMGLDLYNSALAVQLPSEVTLSYLPYALRLPKQTQAAREHGHPLMLHLPMAPVGANDPGPMALHPDLSQEVVHTRLLEALASFSGYVGVNNHMGSLATTDRDLMRIVAVELKQRGLFFVDSRTTSKSVAADVMQEAGVAVAVRHVFLDDQVSERFIRMQLAQAEKIAQHRGAAVVIGHPHELTLSLVREWIPALEGKGIRLVPITELLTR